MRALLLVLGASLAGAAYFVYLRSEPFPPAIVRLIPVAWLAGSTVGGIQAVRALRAGGSRLAAGLALALGIPSVALAAMFAMGALMGD